jgi:flagellar hook assembly protein FlgD
LEENLKPFLTVLFFSLAALGLAQSNDLYVSKNMFTPGVDSVDIQVTAVNYPNTISVRIFNTAGELVRILSRDDISGPFTQTYTWDGKNVNGEKVGSGVYLILFQGSQFLKTARVIAVQ